MLIIDLLSYDKYTVFLPIPTFRNFIEEFNAALLKVDEVVGVVNDSVAVNVSESDFGAI